MAQQTGDPKSSTDHFDAAKAIVNTLQKLDKSAQALAIRFASETLGLDAAPKFQSPPPLATQSQPVSATLEDDGATDVTNIRQFTEAKTPKSDQQFAAIVAYFYLFKAPESERLKTINGKKLIEAARLAGRHRPKNPTLTLVNAKNSGYLDGVGKGQYQINSVGENLVAMTLPLSESNIALRNKKFSKKKPSKKKTAKTSSTKTTKKKRKRRT